MATAQTRSLRRIVSTRIPTKRGMFDAIKFQRDVPNSETELPKGGSGTEEGLAGISEAPGASRMNETRQGMVTVAESGSGPYSQLVHAGRHVLSADEPEASGGHDVGPSPYEYLLAGLGACTAMTLRSYVERHNWGLRRTTVELWHETRPAADGKSMIDHFHRAIHFDGDLTEEQRLRLLEIAERCPVSQTLRHSSAIDSRLANSAPPIAA